jgi:uncharacterized protein YkwD
MSPRRGAPRPCRSIPALTALVLAATALAPSTADARPTGAQAAARTTSARAPSADAGVESQFVSRINSLRASKGLGPLSVSGELVGVARSWTDRMVEAGQISHNPALGSSVGGAWTKLGENVGVGYAVDGLMQAFINSPAHYRNLVDPDWTHVGVGVTTAVDGRIYTTHNFMALGTPAPPPTTPPTAPPPPPAAVPVARTAPDPGPAAPAPAPSSTPPTPAAPDEPRPTRARVVAVLDPLRSLEGS